MKISFKKVIKIILVLIILVILIPFFIYFYYSQFIYTSTKSVKNTDIAIVFGAGIYSNGDPTPMLEDRLLTAYELYNQGKIKKILVSGDNRTLNYNEPQNMYNFLVKKGVKSEDIYKDYAGRRSYDTCYRAKHIFSIKKAVLISQGYHLPRAIFLCKKLGINASGIYSNKRQYVGSDFYKIRELLAIYKSIIDLYIKHPKVIKGDKTEIK